MDRAGTKSPVPTDQTGNKAPIAETPGPAGQGRALTVASVSLRRFTHPADTVPAAETQNLLNAYLGQLELVTRIRGGRCARPLGDTVCWVHGIGKPDRALAACTPPSIWHNESGRCPRVL